MASKLSSCFLSHGLAGLACNRELGNVPFFYMPSPRLLSASCKMRQRGFGFNRRQQVKKSSNEPIPLNLDFQADRNEESEPENVMAHSVPSLNSKAENKDDIHSTADIKDVNEYTGKKDDIHPTVEIHHANEHEEGDGLAHSIPRLNSEAEKKDDIHATAEIKEVNECTGKKDDIHSAVEIHHANENEEGKDHGHTTVDIMHADGQKLGNLALPEVAKALAINRSGGEQLSSVQLEELMSMIRNAEKNVLLLDQARATALDDLHKILGEKETLQGEINVLVMKLAETDERIRVASQQKVRVEILEEQLEKLRHELVSPPGSDEYVLSLSKELDTLRMENLSLKNDIEVLKSELHNVKDTDERVVVLEKECSGLGSSLKELESKFSVSQEDVSKLSALKGECKNLSSKVDNLQVLLDKATKQADQAILVLQQNKELRKKVDKLEESLEEVAVYKISSVKTQQYNELMQQKIKLLEERLEKSDAEILSCIELYQESIKVFQETLEKVKEESNKEALDGPINDMPWDFWSRLLLMVDGWILEKKISSNDVNLLREMVWKRDRRIHDAYIACKDENEGEAISAFLKLLASPTSPGLHVVHIAAEMAPVAKVGGLGDVVTGLGKALQRRGHLVEIVLPKYDCMQYERIHDLRVLDGFVESYFDGELYKNKIWVGTVEGLPVYFIEPHHPNKFFWRGQFYGEHDDFKRFSYFSRAALELLLQAGKKPDIIHCHDWQTAFVAPLYWDLYAPKGLNSARICFTCHNFEYQGTAPASDLASCGLDVSQLNRPDRMQDNSSHDRVNPVKGAIVFSNIVTTVSPTYAQEVLSSEGGRGLHSTLNIQSKKFIGILNGIDTDAWNPATDNFLKVQYSANDLQGKEENKYALRLQLGLSSSDGRRPLVGCITRLVPQKGVHLIRHAIYRTVELGGQFVLLGSSPVPHIQREFKDIEQQFQNHSHVRLILKYDESLSHSIYAASDMFIIPSIFEPCGLTQMISMRYGAIPIARKTGGLNDSVFDIDDETIPPQFQNGFTFATADEQGLNHALERAINHYRNNVDGWNRLIQKVMQIDFSWATSATQYEELYTKSVARARAAANRI